MPPQGADGSTTREIPSCSDPCLTACSFPAPQPPPPPLLGAVVLIAPEEPYPCCPAHTWTDLVVTEGIAMFWLALVSLMAFAGHNPPVTFLKDC